jgi:hypothetical protein
LSKNLYFILQGRFQLGKALQYVLLSVSHSEHNDGLLIDIAYQEMPVHHIELQILRELRPGSQEAGMLRAPYEGGFDIAHITVGNFYAPALNGVLFDISNVLEGSPG